MVNDIAVQEFVKAIKEEPQDTNKTYNATVSRVDGEGVVWVNIYGSDKETPTSSTSTEVKRGDSVTVNWRNNKLYIGGNYSNPSAGMGTVAPSVNYVNDLIDKDISVASINAATGYIGDLTAENITTENIKATNGYIQHLVADDITAEDISASSGYIKDLTSENITAENIIADHETVGSLNANYAHITNGVIDNAKIGYADVNNLNAHYAEIDMANVNNAWIENGSIKKAEVFDENVFDLSGNRATLSRIDASKINVANLRADNLVVRRINGQPVVGGYTLIDSNSPGYSSKNPQALGWYEFVNAQWVLSTDTTVDMTKAYYQEGNEVSLYDQQYIDDMENDLQQQIDGAVETFTGSVVPTLTNWPYTDWYDTSVTPIHDERAKHVGDIYYVVNSSIDEGGYCYRFTYDNTTTSYAWVLIKDSDVTKALSDISELQTFESETTSWMDETDEGIETIRTNHTTLAGIVDKTVKESIQLWFTKANTTAPNKPTAEVTSTSTDGNGWRKVVPAYNASYPNYFYCWQYKFVDNTFGWSAVVRDIAMGETQGTSRDAKNKADAALPASTFTSFESTTFKDVKDTVTEHSTTFTNMTGRLGMNSDGTGANTDIVAKESALEQTVDGISTRVGKTETKLIGMYATSSTAEGTAAKVATITPALPSGATWELGTGTIITVKFTNANTAANPTLNVNSKGAKAIKTYANGNLSADEYKWKAGSTFTFTYNGTNWLMQDSSASVRMNSAETGITQNADAIKLEAVRRESAVNMLLDSDAKEDESSDYPSTSSTNISKVNAPDIRYWSNSTHSAVTCTLVSISDPPESGIKYAARFVCDGTQTAVNTRAYTFYGGNGNKIPFTLGQTYTASWWARCTSGSGQTGLDVTGKSATEIYIYTPDENLTSEWKRYTYTFTFDALYTTSDYQRIWFRSRFPANTAGTVEICGCKLIAGDAVEAYKTTIEQTADNVLIKATKNYSKDSSLTDAQNGGKAAIQSLINVAPEGVQISADKVNITGTAVFNAVNSDASAKAAMLNSEIEMGGRNILRGTNNIIIANGFYPKGEWYKSGTGTVTTSVAISDSPLSAFTTAVQLTTTAANTDVGIAQGGVPFHTGEITHSVWVKGNAGDTIRLQPIWAQGTNVPESGSKSFTIADGNWHKYTFTKSVAYNHPIGSSGAAANNTYANAGYVYFKSATVGHSCLVIGDMLEYGNKATDWSPAPEDSLAEEQRIYYRSDSTSPPSAPSTWVTSTSTANSTWTTKRMQYDSTYKYLYTCIQQKAVGGNVTNSTVLLDDTTTVIDGGNIITGSVTANQLSANAVTADKIAIGAINEYENILLDSDAPTLTKVKASYDRYWSDSGNSKIVCSNFTLTDAPEQGLKYGRRFVYDGSVATNNYNRAYAFYNTNDNAIPFVPNQTYTATWWARCTSGSGRTRISHSKGDGATGITTGATYTLTSYWKKYTYSFTFGSVLNTSANRIWFYALFPKSTAGTVEICGCKLTVDADAESYITRIDNNGIRIHPSSTENNSVVINSNGMEVFKGGTESANSVAKYGDTSRVGKESGFHVVTNPSDITFKDETKADIVKFGTRTVNSHKVTDIDSGFSRIWMREGDDYSDSSVAMEVFKQGSSEEYGWTAMLSGSDGLSVKNNYTYEGTTINGDVKTSGLYSGYKNVYTGQTNTTSTTTGTVVSATSVPNNTWKAITSFTLKNGTYMLCASISFPSNTTGYRAANFNISSGSNWIVASTPPVNGDTRLNLTQIVDVTRDSPSSESKTFYLNVYQNSGAAMNVSAEYWYVAFR